MSLLCGQWRRGAAAETLLVAKAGRHRDCDRLGGASTQRLPLRVDNAAIGAGANATIHRPVAVEGRESGKPLKREHRAADGKPDGAAALDLGDQHVLVRLDVRAQRERQPADRPQRRVDDACRGVLLRRKRGVDEACAAQSDFAQPEPARETRVAGKAWVGLAVIVADAPELVEAEVQCQLATGRVTAERDAQVSVAQEGRIGEAACESRFGRISGPFPPAMTTTDYRAALLKLLLPQQ